MFDRQGFRVRTTASECQPAAQDSTPTEMSFTPEETTRLLIARGRHQRGELNEWEIDHRRLRFACWLYEHGYISG